MNANDHLEGLRRVPMFSALDEAQLHLLADAFEFQQHPDGHLFGKAGRQGSRDQDALHVVLVGEIVVTTQPRAEGQVPVRRVMKAGELFGLITFLKGGARTATTRASGAVEVAVLSHETYEQVVRRNPALHCALLLAIAGQLARDVRKCNQRLVDAASKPPA